MLELVKRHGMAMFLCTFVAVVMYFVYNSNFVIVAWDKEDVAKIIKQIEEETPKETPKDDDDRRDRDEDDDDDDDD